VVDTQGLLVAVQGPPASMQDPVGAGPVLAAAKQAAPPLHLLWSDGRYHGPLVSQAAEAVGLRVEGVGQPPDTRGLAVLPRRWVGERTFAWLGTYRRIAGRDVETNPRTSEAWSKGCRSHLMLRRLAKTSPAKHSQ
jgi:transposase